MNLVDSNLVNLVDGSRGWISWMNLVDESMNLVDESRESRGWISRMDLVDSNLVNLVDGSRGWISSNGCSHTLDRSRGRRIIKPNTISGNR